MSVIIGGDICPTAKNREQFIKADVSKLFGAELSGVLNDADMRIVNLEAPLCNDGSPIKKCGPALSAPEECVNALTAARIDIVSLANNHIMDQGEKGLSSTISALDANGIAHIGAGMRLSSAAKPIFFDHKGVRLGVLAFTEHEFSIAEENTAGAAPFDPLTSLDAVFEARRSCGFLIVLYHGGKELYPYPSPQLQRVCRKLVEKGASLVLCQHSHCIGCEEKYMGSTILYGQGNFLFDSGSEKCQESSLLVRLNDDLSVEYIPIAKHRSNVRLASKAEADEIMKAFYERSEAIAKEGAVEDMYSRYAKGMRTELLGNIGGRESLLFRALNKLSGNRLRKARIARRYPEASKLMLLNRIECEAWRELLTTAIRDDLNKQNR